MEKELLNKIKIEKEKLLQDGFKIIGVFGSYAKNTQTKDSDIDFFIEFQKPDYSLLMGLYSYLENKLNSKIDIVRKGPHLSDRFFEHIKKELIYV